VNFRTTGATGVDQPITPPGEPYVDANANGQYDDGETHINLTYPTVHTDGYLLDTVTPHSTVITDYDAVGAPQTVEIVFSGVLYTSGRWEAQGNAGYFGSVVAKEGMGGGSGGTPNVFFDIRMTDGTWPPDEYDIPKVIITAWETDL